jgi:hypothetical protein
MKRFLGALAIIGAFAVGPAHAQVTSDSLGLSQVTSTCLSASASDSACDAAVQAYLNAVATSGLDANGQDDLLAELVVALGGNASSLSPAIRTRVAAVIRDIATQVSDPDRAAAIVAAADDVVAGIDVTAPRVSGSPG